MTETPPASGTIGWDRTDPRMLLIKIARALASLVIPVALLTSGLGDRDEGSGPLLLTIGSAVAAVVLGTTSWSATRYRFDGVHLQVRTGVLARRVRTVRVDRVRSVELEAELVHRVIGLAKVTIGTGSDDEQITLDSLSRERSARLREELLRRGRAAAATSAATAFHTGPNGPGRGVGQPGEDAAPDTGAHRAEPFRLTGTAAPAGQCLAEFEPSWVRFSLGGFGGLATLLAVAGAAWFLLRDVLGGVPVVQDVGARIGLLPTAALVAGGVVLLLLAGAALSAVGYGQTWWRMRLVREPGGTLHLSRGLTTATSSTLEEARIRGVEVVEPFTLRALRGARLKVLTTGVGTEGTSDVLPPCPREVATRVGRQVLEGPDEEDDADPLTVPTRRHGRRARRRLHVRAQVRGLVLVGAAALVISWRGWPAELLLGGLVWALLSAALADAAYRTLGHAVTSRHLVVTYGALWRRRVVLQHRGVIGWTLVQSVMQRRVGLATLTATTAAGPESVEIRDLPLTWAVALAVEATPDVLAPFIGRSAPADVVA